MKKVKREVVVKLDCVEKWYPQVCVSEKCCYSPTPMFDWRADVGLPGIGGALHELLLPKEWKKGKKYKIIIEEL